MCAVKKHMCQI